MIVDNPPMVPLVLDGIYSGPASVRDGVATFPYRGAIQRRKAARGTLDGVPGRFTVEQIKDFDRVTRPFLQAILTV